MVGLSDDRGKRVLSKTGGGRDRLENSRSYHKKTVFLCRTHYIGFVPWCGRTGFVVGCGCVLAVRVAVTTTAGANTCDPVPLR